MIDLIQKYFNADKLSRYDKVSTIVYLILTLIIAGIPLFVENIELQNKVIFGYAFLTPMLLYGLNYKSLRNIKMFIIWIGIGIIHLFIFRYLSQNPDLMLKKYHAANGLRFTIYFVILFEIIRIIHLRVMKYELVSLGGYGATTDIWENRKIKMSDSICFFTYLIIWIVVYLIF